MCVSPSGLHPMFRHTLTHSSYFKGLIKRICPTFSVKLEILLMLYCWCFLWFSFYLWLKIKIYYQSIKSNPSDIHWSLFWPTSAFLVSHFFLPIPICNMVSNSCGPSGKKVKVVCITRLSTLRLWIWIHHIAVHNGRQTMYNKNKNVSMVHRYPILTHFYTTAKIKYF